MVSENGQGGEDVEVETGVDGANGESEESNGGGESILGEEIKFLIEAGANEDPVLNARLMTEVAAIRSSVGACNISKFYGSLGGGFENYSSVIKNVKLLSREQEVVLIRAFRAGGMAVRHLVTDTFTVANQRWVLREAIKCSNKTGVSLEDCIANGNLGFFKAVPKFDPDSGNKFMTYAGRWVLQCMNRGVADICEVYRIPVHVHELLSVISRAKGVLDGEGEDYTDDDVATHILRGRVRKRLCGDNGDCSEEDIDTWINEHPKESHDTTRNVLSVLKDRPPSVSRLDGAVKSNGLSGRDSEATELGEFIHSGNLGAYRFPAVGKVDGVDDVERKLDDVPVRWAIDKILRMRERMIVMLRGGIGFAETPHVLDEVGDMFGFTRERARQLEAKGHDCLRDILSGSRDGDLAMLKEVREREKHYLSCVDRANELNGKISDAMETENASVILDFVLRMLGRNSVAIAVMNMLFGRRWMYHPLVVAEICGVKYDVIELVAYEVIEKLSGLVVDVVDLKLLSCRGFGQLTWDSEVDDVGVDFECNEKKELKIAPKARARMSNVRACVKELMESNEGIDVVLRLPMRERAVALLSVGVTSDESAHSFDDISSLMKVSYSQIYNISVDATRIMKESIDIWDFNDGLSLCELESELISTPRLTGVLFMIRSVLKRSDVVKRLNMIIGSVDDKCAKAVISMLFSKTKYNYSVLDIINVFGVNCQAIERIAEEVLGYLRDWPDDDRVRMKTCLGFSYRPEFVRETHKIKDGVQIDFDDESEEGRVEREKYRAEGTIGEIIAIRKSIGIGSAGVRFSGDYEASVQAVGNLSNEQQIYLGKVLKYGVDEARDLAGETLILSCLKGVVSVTKTAECDFGVDMQDVIQGMNLDVLRILDKFDIDKCGRARPFTFYLSQYVFGRFWRAVNRAWPLVDVPVHVLEDWRKICCAVDMLVSNGAELTPDSVAKRVCLSTSRGMTSDNVEDLARVVSREIVSLSKIVRVSGEKNEKVRCSDTLPCDFGWENTYRDPFVPVEEMFAMEEERVAVLRAVAKVKVPLHRSILLLRNGVAGDEAGYRLEQVGYIFNRTRERIRQIQNKVEGGKFRLDCRDRHDLRLISEQCKVFERLTKMSGLIEGERGLVDELNVLLGEEHVNKGLDTFINAFGEDGRLIRAAVVMLCKHPSCFTFREIGVVCNLPDEQVRRIAEFVLDFFRDVFDRNSDCEVGTVNLVAKNLSALINGEEDDVSDLDD